MISLSSTSEVVSAFAHARDISLCAYTLADGAVLDALTTAAKRGAHVRVRLEGYIYKDDGSIGQGNASAVARLREAGADAALVHEDAAASDAMLHLKGAVADGTLYLNDRNWPDDGADTIVRDTFAGDANMVTHAIDGHGVSPTAFLAVRKRDALASEARLLHAARAGDEILMESESFGGRNAVFDALDDAAKRGAHVRLLVSARDLKNNPHEQASIVQLERDGVQAKACEGDEKFAIVAGARGWIGSANASAAFNKPDQLDWGLRTDNPSILAHARAAFESRWQTASEVK